MLRTKILKVYHMTNVMHVKQYKLLMLYCTLYIIQVTETIPSKK